MAEQKTKISGILLEADKPNLNGRIYPKHVLEKAVKEYNEKKKPGTILGTEFGDDALKLGWILHEVESLELVDNKLVATISVIDGLPMGKRLKNLVESGSDLKLTSVGIGTISKDRVVGDDYKLLEIAVYVDDKK